VPRCYSFCEDEAGVIPDSEDLEDEPAALAQAMVAAGEIMRSNSLAGREALVGPVLLVKDNAGALRPGKGTLAQAREHTPDVPRLTLD
jgi:hypothetical protein